MNPSKWLTGYVEHVRNVLGLHAWSFNIQIVDQPNSDNPKADATAFISYRYLSAVLKFKTSIASRRTDGMKVLVIHELLHVVNAGKDLAVHNVMSQYVPVDHQQFAVCLVTDADEHMVERLANALLAVVGDPEKPTAGAGTEARK